MVQSYFLSLNDIFQAISDFVITENNLENQAVTVKLDWSNKNNDFKLTATVLLDNGELGLKTGE